MAEAENSSNVIDALLFFGCFVAGMCGLIWLSYVPENEFGHQVGCDCPICRHDL